jgi:choloylglycine hydrolase
LFNKGNYVGLSSVDAASITIGGTVYAPAGHGSGMRGVPGDSTPPSRFIRALLQKQSATQPTNSTEASNLAVHLLNTVDIPLGTSAAPSQPDDYTQWVVVKALTARTFSYRTAGNPTVMQIDLAGLDLSNPVETAYSMPTKLPYLDITQQLLPVLASSR